MTLIRFWPLGATIVVAGFASCTQSYDDFDFSGQTPAGTSGGTPTATTTGSGTTGGGGTGAQGGTGGSGAVGGTGGSGAVGGTGGSGAQGGSGATGGTGGGGALTCTSQYSNTNIFELCSETATECEFRVQTNNGEHCEDICQADGGECLAFYNDNPNGSCNRGSQATCTTEYGSALCICSLGCGSGPPCQAPQICSGGSCN